jgi:hypothetical protein
MALPTFTTIRSDDAHVSRVQDNVARAVNPVIQAISTTPIGGSPPPPQQSPSLLNGFTNVLTGYAPFGCHKDCLGYVHVGGLVKNTAGCAAGTSVVLLPPGLRPAQKRAFVVQYSGAFGLIAVDSAGSIAVQHVIAAGGTLTMEFTFLGEV